MAKKVVVCLFLFLILFIGAFSLDRQLSREFYDPTGGENDGMVQVQQLDDGTPLEFLKNEIFAPREYVRIISTDKR
ncbi:hypothetical protein [Bacillus sp. B15-48]|uniref:hypothetical protein n=1 Tax=Bacillus sp. B15-48 TaxID=1548601 RepID=UPI00193FD623|nr:hypothetical protein [Bacillus sp. B15-48]MBM4760710.1 hypothetical protein [Bacillus sp. B15-48]